LTGATLKADVLASSLTSLGTITSLVATTADINAGTFDGIVGGTTPADGSFTTLSATGDVTLSTHLVGGDGTTNPTNLLTNGDFELWSAGTSSVPDGWVLAGADATIAREASTIKIGTYSVAATLAGASGFYLTQTIYAEKGIDYWKGRTITVSCWIKADNADTGFYINDGIGSTTSNHSGGNTWEYVTATRTISASASTLTINLRVTQSETAYFDGAMCVEGAMPYAFSPKPLPRGGTITAEVDETKFSHKIPVDIDGTLYYIMLTDS